MGGEQGESSDAGAEISEGELLRFASSNLDNDFEHQCFEIAVPRLGARRLPPREGDMGPHVFGIPGIPTGRFLPHQVWGIWFLVDRVLTSPVPVALLADDMGLGKTFTALGALLHLKWIASEAALGRRLSCLNGLTISDLRDNAVPPFLGSEKEVYSRPALVMVPANLIGQWSTTITGLLEGTANSLVNLNLPANRFLGARDLNHDPTKPERGHEIHLISYTTYRVRWFSGVLTGCAWSIGIFDESHTVRTETTRVFRALMDADVRGKIQLTGTPMYHSINSWLVQTRWLFARVSRAEQGEHGSEKLEEIMASIKTGDADMEQVYRSLKEAAYPWLIRRWAETKGSDGEPLVALVKHVMHDVRLNFTEMERNRLLLFLKNIKEEKKNKVATVIHEWRLACLTMDLPDNDTVEGAGGEYHYRQAWDPVQCQPGPALRWLSDHLVPILLGPGADGVHNKAAIFAPLPGQAWYIHWYLNTFHPGLKSFIFHADIPSAKRDDVIEAFSTEDAPSALVLTPALGGTGLNLVAANHIVIIQKFWVLNEQRQAIGRIDRLGQKRTPNIWVLHCGGTGSVDHRAEELHLVRAVFEARIMQGIMDVDFSYIAVLNACNARALQTARRVAEIEEENRTRVIDSPPSGPGPASRKRTPNLSDG